MPMLRSLIASLRRLAARPAFTITAVLTLALGIGASTAIYSVAYAVLLRPLPYDQPHQLVTLAQVGASGQRMQFSLPNYDDLREASGRYRVMARYSAWPAAVVGGTEPVRAFAANVSADFFDLLGVRPARGRAFSPAEVTRGGPPAVLISHTFWRESLAGHTEPLGQTLRIADTPHTIVGVLPEGFAFPAGTSLWTAADREAPGDSRTAHNWRVIARLRDGATTAAAQQEATAIARRLEATHGDDTWMKDASVRPLRDALVGDVRPIVAVLVAAVGCLLLVACVTVVNLLIAQGVLRSHEFAVRRALGATGSRLVRQIMGENLILTTLGGVLGLWLAQTAIRGLLAIEPGRLPLGDTIAVDAGAAAFTLALTCGLAVLLALVTSGRVTRQTPLTALAGGGRAGIGGRGVERMRRSLVVAQIAFTLVLLGGAGLLGERLAFLLRADPGFPTSGLLVASATFPRAPLDEGLRRSQEITDIVTRLRAIGPVDAAGGINAFPLTGTGANGMFLEMRPGDRVESLDDFLALAKLPDRAGYAEYRVATPGYFEAMGIELRAGRLFTWSDTAAARHVAIVSESLARQRWPDADPIGREIQFGNMDGDPRPMTVVGVVGDVRDRRIDGEPTAIFYGHAAQRTQAFSSFTFVVRGPADPLSVAADARTAVHAVAPEVPVATRAVDQVLAATYGNQRFSLLIVVLFAASALVLAVSGLYGVAAYATSSRTREIGVRMALGANTGRIMRMMLREGLVLAAAGTAVGVVAALVAARTFASALTDLGQMSVTTLVLAAGVMALAALAACLVPARRAARVEPALAIRDQ